MRPKCAFRVPYFQCQSMPMSGQEHCERHRLGVCFRANCYKPAEFEVVISSSPDGTQRKLFVCERHHPRHETPLLPERAGEAPKRKSRTGMIVAGVGATAAGVAAIIWKKRYFGEHS
jgi:hypothetical protein